MNPWKKYVSALASNGVRLFTKLIFLLEKG